jgi:hypothetical protein
MSFVLFGALIAAANQPPQPDDVVVQADGSLLHGRVISCAEAIRFVPVGAGEVLLSPESVLAVTLASGKPCVLRRHSGNVGAGIAAVVLIPVLGSVLGAVIGSQACHGDDSTPCALGGAAAGAAVGLVLGGTILIASATASDEIILPKAPVASARKRSAAFSVTLRF